jgi:hypothetical protein
VRRCKGCISGCRSTGRTEPTLEIVTYGKLAEGQAAVANRPGFAHIAFAVPDVALAKAAVLDGGGTALGDIVTTRAGDRTVTWTYVQDPEGIS